MPRAIPNWPQLLYILRSFSNVHLKQLYIGDTVAMFQKFTRKKELIYSICFLKCFIKHFFNLIDTFLIKILT
jgi:hypothetical protein